VTYSEKNRNFLTITMPYQVQRLFGAVKHIGRDRRFTGSRIKSMLTREMEVMHIAKKINKSRKKIVRQRV